MIGLEPIAHPPGKDTFASLYLANKGPRTKTPARIVFKRRYEAKVFNDFLLLISIFLLFLSNFILDPIVLKSSIIVITSFTMGMFLIVTFLFVNIVAANIGRVAFFEPEIVIVPDIFLPPLISNFCI